MGEKKKYYSESLGKIISEYITKDVYGDFQSFIKEIFQRRAYEFGFSDEQMREELISFTKNVKSVKFASKEEMGKATYKGVYIVNSNEIKLNEDYFSDPKKTPEQLGEDLFETLTHEVYHGINDYAGESGLTYYDSEKEEIKGTALDEVFVETAANRASMTRGIEEQFKYRAETTGYGDITFVTNLLAASIGVTEKELLAAGIKDRASLMKVFDSKFPTPENAEKARTQIFEPLETNLDIVYNLRYDSDNNFGKMERTLLLDSLTALYSKSYELASFQIQDDERPLSEEYTQELIFRFKKMETILTDSLNEFKKIGAISSEEIKQIKSGLVTPRRRLLMRVAGIMMLDEYADSIGELDEYARCITEVKEGKLAYTKNLLKEKYRINPGNVELKKIMAAEDSLYKDYIFEEDFDSGLKWDNKLVSKNILKLLQHHKKDKATRKIKKATEKENEEGDSTSQPIKKESQGSSSRLISGEKNKGVFSGIRNKIGSFFARFVNKRLLLEESTDENKKTNTEYVNEEKSNFDQYIVSEEELTPLSEVVRETNTKTHINELEKSGKEHI